MRRVLCTILRVEGAVLGLRALVMSNLMFCMFGIIVMVIGDAPPCIIVVNDHLL